VRNIAMWVKEQRQSLRRVLGLKRSRMPGYETFRTVVLAALHIRSETSGFRSDPGSFRRCMRFFGSTGLLGYD
jgi:hypothetical protein